MPARARGAGDHDPRSELPHASRADARRDPPRLPGARARARASRRRGHRAVARSRPAKSSGCSACRASGSRSARRARPTGRRAAGRAERRLRAVLRHARTAQERRRAAGRVRAARSRRRGRASAARSSCSPARRPTQRRPWLERIAGRRCTASSAISATSTPANGGRSTKARACWCSRRSRGFGMPVLEAMTLGVPVVAANRGSLPEVLGDAGCWSIPIDPADIADAIARLLDDDGLAAACAANGVARARAFQLGTTRPSACTTRIARPSSGARGRAAGPSMRIGIDARELCGRSTGVGRYLGGLLREWADDDRARAPRVRALRARAARRCRSTRAASRRAPIAGGGGTWWEQVQLPRAVGRDHLDVFFAPAYTAPLRLARADRGRHPRPVVRRAPRVVPAARRRAAPLADAASRPAARAAVDHDLGVLAARADRAARTCRRTRST